MGFYIVQVLTGLSTAASLFLVSVGLSIVFGVTRVVNFAHGSFFMLGAYLGIDLVDLFGRSHLGFWGGILAAALAVGLVGVLVEVLLLRRIYAAPELFQLLATFGVVLIVQDLALLIWGPEDRIGPRAPGFRGSIEIMGSRLPIYDLVLIAAGPLILVVLRFLFHRTRWGVLVRAATADRDMVAALGVDQRRLFTTAFFVGSVLAGLGGALQLPKEGANLLMDATVIGTAFVVVVIGGLGSIGGAFVASLIVGQIQVFGILILPQATLVLIFLVMAIVLVLRPHGLFGRPEGIVEDPLPADATAAPRAAAGRAGLLLLAVLATAPLWLPEWGLVLGIEILLMAVFAASLHAIMGGGGIVSFGHAAYFGAGAYGAALLATGAGLPMVLAVPGGVAAAFVLAFVAGWLLARMRGVYLAMLSLAVAQIVWSTAVQWQALTGGDDGVLGVWPPGWASTRPVFYLLTLAVAAAVIVGLRRLATAPFGWGLRAARDHPVRAEALGIDTRRQRWLAFAISGAAAGVAGALYAFSKGSVFPDELGISRSIDALVMVLLGGVHATTGPLVGAAAFTGLHDLLARFTLWRLALGVAIIVLVVAFPGGIVGGVRRLVRGARPG